MLQSQSDGGGLSPVTGSCNAATATIKLATEVLGGTWNSRDCYGQLDPITAFRWYAKGQRDNAVLEVTGRAPTNPRRPRKVGVLIGAGWGIRPVALDSRASTVRRDWPRFLMG